jgi:uncharacterized protein YbjT (DUF2867 family)
MDKKIAFLLGASGLTGSHLLHLLLEHPSIHKVRALVRTPIGISHPKLEECVIDFNDISAFEKNIGSGDFIFSCVGTTLKKVKGNKQLYRTIDFDIPVNAARFGIKARYQKFMLLSAHLANPQSLVFYNRLKGETEEIISTFPYASIHIFRPSFLVGERKEKRWLEITLGKCMQRFSFLLPDSYKPISAEKVAQAMIQAAFEENEGRFLYQFKQMI